MDEVIAGYRELTGKAPIMPKWAYGFWQSRQRYETQDQLLGVLREYRKRGLPLDNIVQDWIYWPQDQWGCQCFDPARFPDPQGDGRRGPRQRRARDDLGLGEILSEASPTISELDAVGGILRNMVNPRPDEPTATPITSRHVPRLGRAGILRTLSTIRTIQRRATSTARQVSRRHREQGLRRLVARFRRARLPLQPLDRGAHAAHGPDGARPGAQPSSTHIRSRTSTAFTTIRSPTSPTSGRSS